MSYASRSADVPIAAIDPLDIAAVAAKALTESGHDSAIYRLTGPEAILPAHRVRVLADLLGRPLKLEPLSNEEAREQISADMPAEYVDAFFSFFVDGTYDDSRVLSDRGATSRSTRPQLRTVGRRTRRTSFR